MRKWFLKSLLVLSVIPIFGLSPTVASARGHFHGFHGSHTSFNDGGGGGDTSSAPQSVLGLHGDRDDSDNLPVNANQSVASIANDGIKLQTGEIYYYPGTTGFFDHYYDHDRYLGIPNLSSINNYSNYRYDTETRAVNDADNDLLPATNQMLIDQDIQYQRTNLQPRIFINIDVSKIYEKDFASSYQDTMRDLGYSDEDGDQLKDYDQSNRNGAVLLITDNRATNHPTQFVLYLDRDLKRTIPPAKIKALVNAHAKQLHSQNLATLNAGIIGLNRGLTQLIWQYRLAPEIQHPSWGIDDYDHGNGQTDIFANVIVPLLIVGVMVGALGIVVWQYFKGTKRYRFKD